MRGVLVLATKRKKLPIAARSHRRHLEGGAVSYQRGTPVEGGAVSYQRGNPVEGGAVSDQRGNPVEGGAVSYQRGNPVEGGAVSYEQGISAGPQGCLPTAGFRIQGAGFRLQCVGVPPQRGRRKTCISPNAASIVWVFVCDVRIQRS